MGVNAEANKQVYELTADQVFALLNTTEAGLTEEEAVKRLLENGKNALTAKKKISAKQIFLEQFKNTLTLILIASSFLILFIYFFGEHDRSDLIEAGLILAIVFLVTILGFIQEFKAEKAVESLKKLLAFKARVRRDNQEKEIDVADLVVGDIVVLEEGVKSPADIRLLQSFSLRVNESSLTGEAKDVGKSPNVLTENIQIADQSNMLFAGTSIASGRGVGVVVATGDSTEIGKIAHLVASEVDEQTPIQEKLEDIGKKLGYIILGICVVVFIFIMFLAKNFSDQTLLERLIHSFIAAVALAVAAIPEGLPAVVTISLALGTQRLLKKNALVRKLSSVETLGSTDVICSDKTGTLTKGEMTVKHIYAEGKEYEVTGAGYEKTGTFRLGDEDTSPDDISLLIKVGALCNNASFMKDGKILGDSTEAALLVLAEKAGLKDSAKRVLEIPFSSERKFMTTVVEDEDEFLVCSKGAPEMLIQKCSKIFENKKDDELTDEARNKILQKDIELSQKALRNLGIAYKRLSRQEYEQICEDQDKIESGLVFLGITSMIDPPREDVGKLIDELSLSEIRVIMITGDHIETAKSIGAQIGIKGDALSGMELEKMNDEEFAKSVESVSIYARVNPSVKMRIVEALKNKGHVVAMTGDGVNDAPALKKADIGIAMGITGTDVAKEASDMVLLDDHFATIVTAVREGRGIFHNIHKFVYYLLSCNMAEVMIVFLAIILFQDPLLSATMLLWINVVTDGLPAIALGMDDPEKGIMKHKPSMFQSDIVTKKHWIEMSLISIVIAIVTLVIYELSLPYGVAEAKAVVFTALVVFELLQILLIRSEYRLGFFSNKWLILAVVGTGLLQLCVVYIAPIAQMFEISKFSSTHWISIGFGCIVISLFFKVIPRILAVVLRK